MALEEFHKDATNTVSSTNGFTVEVRFGGGVLYRDHDGEIPIDSEWLAEPHRILLYLPRCGGSTRDRINRILPGVVRALEYLGHPVELWE
jgi:hypothetical protein